MVGLGLVRAHGLADNVAVPARPDAAADDYDHAVAALGAHLRQQGYSAAVDVVERLGGIAQTGAPVEIRTPRGRVEDDADAVALGDRDVGRVVAP